MQEPVFRKKKADAGNIRLYLLISGKNTKIWMCFCPCKISTFFEEHTRICGAVGCRTGSTEAEAERMRGNDLDRFERAVEMIARRSSTQHYIWEQNASHYKSSKEENESKQIPPPLVTLHQYCYNNA